MLEMRHLSAVLFGMLALFATSNAAAEGSAQLINANGVYQALVNDSVLYVDVLDPATETITWTGAGSVTVLDPTGATVATLASGASHTPLMIGEYEVQVAVDQPGDWDLSVVANNVEVPGRLHAYSWHFDAGSFGQNAALDVSFYAIVPGGAAGETGVVEMAFEGLAGFDFYLFTNRSGVPGFERRSANDSDVTAGISVDYPLYLSPPERATYSNVQPTVSSFTFEGSAGASCNAIVSGTNQGDFVVQSSASGQIEIVCDLDSDGTFDPANDLLLVSSVVAGTNRIFWNGLRRGGATVPAGSYDCQARVTVGELHYVALDIETAFAGLRLFEVDNVGARAPLRMFWNDTGVTGSRVLNNGDTAALTSPAGGLDSGPYATPHDPFSEENPAGNSRAWGRFIASGLGDNAFLDTYGFLAVSAAVTTNLQVFTATQDSDADGAFDFAEVCTFGTDPGNPDSDGDNISDGDETDQGTTAVDTDSDGTIDALDVDSDGDTILDIDEAGDTDLATPPVDNDTGGNPDYRDVDSDGDGLLDRIEAGDTDPNTPPADINGDMVFDFQDPDLDDDTVLDGVDNCLLVPNPSQADVDADGDGDACDADTDNDGIDDVADNCPQDVNPAQSDTDGDMLGDACDDDDDDDGVLDAADNCPFTVNPMQADGDNDGVGDACEDDRDGDGILDGVDNCPDLPNGTQDDGDNDGIGDVCDDDGDNDGVLDVDDNCAMVANSGQEDVDNDGVGDACDVDADNDGVDDDVDNCPDDANADQADSDDDGIGDACDAPDAPDADDDGIEDAADNCPDVANPDQADADDDGVGDACDEPTVDDSDGDGVDDADDNCPDDANPDQSDADDDGEGDVCDETPNGDEPDPPIPPRDDSYIEIGGGCATAGHSTPTGAMLGLLLIGLLSLRRRRISLLIGCATLLITSTAWAQKADFQVEQFEPLPSQATSTLNVMRSDVLGHLIPSAGLMLHFADDPLVAYRFDGDGERTIASRLIDDQLTAEVSIGLGFFNVIDLGAVLPLALYATGDGDSVVGGTNVVDGFAQGDARVVPRVRLLNPAKAGGIGLGFAVPVFLPLGKEAQYRSDGQLRAEPRLAVDYRWLRNVVALNIAYQVRPEVVTHNYSSDDAFRWALGAEVGVGPSWLSVVGSLFGSYTLADGRDPTNLDDLATNATARPVEALTGIEVALDNGLTLQAGGGLGLARSVGAPDFRIFGGIEWSPRDGDQDHDGVLDSVDRCPTEPEDIDKFQDGNGCPDLDNDEDTVPDTSDECPRKLEDVDGFEDTDGCPDPDNDGDGVLDVADDCPDAPGVPEFKGCVDSDGDGISDAHDQCPNDAEDMDKYEDTDGCPELDNDRDGIVDLNDNCPLVAEVINGIEDEDGCPDAGASKVRVTSGKIEILDKVYFETDKAVIQGRSFDVLNQVASVLKANSEITHVRIEGHTDSRGDATHNQQLSQHRADAVKRYLVGRGIDDGRLDAVGYGESTPIAENETSQGRATNRRVEFTILKSPE